MAKAGDNNPRAFGDTVSLDAWRTAFDGEMGVADLHVHVVFSEGRIGGLEAPVRFRLQLRRAEVHVLRDAANVLRIKPSTVAKGESNQTNRTVVNSLETEVTSKAGLNLSATPVADLGHQRKHVLKQEVTSQETGDFLSFTSMRTDAGYAFRISDSDTESLDGSPWSAEQPLLSYTDTKFPRNGGEPPELRVELRCRREDMRIFDIELTGTGDSLINYSANKMMVIEQYIKTELIQSGFLVGDISDPFSDIVIADVSPVED